METQTWLTMREHRRMEGKTEAGRRRGQRLASGTLEPETRVEISKLKVKCGTGENKGVESTILFCFWRSGRCSSILPSVRFDISKAFPPGRQLKWP